MGLFGNHKAICGKMAMVIAMPVIWKIPLRSRGDGRPSAFHGVDPDQTGVTKAAYADFTDAETF